MGRVSQADEDCMVLAEELNKAKHRAHIAESEASELRSKLEYAERLLGHLHEVLSGVGKPAQDRRTIGK